MDISCKEKAEVREIGGQKGSDLPIRTKTTSTRSFLSCFNHVSEDSFKSADVFFSVDDQLLEVRNTQIVSSWDDSVGE